MRKLVPLTARLCGATLVLATAAAAPTRSLVAQAGHGDDSTGVITGIVQDATGTGLPGVQVQVDGTPLRAQTDGRGVFRIVGVRLGQASLVVRRLGYRSASLLVRVASGMGARPLVTLQPAAPQLAPMVVRGARRKYTGRLADFYRRRDEGIGNFITRAQLERRKPHRMTDVLRTVPGVRINRAADGGPGGMVLLRGANCPPLIWMDGLPLSASYFDPDNLSPESVEAVEIYNGVASIPAQFHGTGMRASCGVIVIWTRLDDPVRRSKRAAVAEDPPSDVELPLYSLSEVDTPVQPDPAHPIQALYPNALLAERVTGDAVAEFVVDTLGRVEPGTVLVVTASDDRFVDAVRQALVGSVFKPATLRGRPVRQVTRVPFEFRIDGAQSATR